MAPNRLTPEHFVAFTHHSEAVEALDHIREGAAAFVRTHWSKPGGAGKTGPEWWHNYPLEPAQADPELPPGPNELLRGFSWNLYASSAYILAEGQAGRPLFSAGGRVDHNQAAAFDEKIQWQLRESGFQLLRSREQLKFLSTNQTAIWRLAYPDEILIGSTLEQQSDALGRWAVESFDLLRSILLGKAPLTPWGRMAYQALARPASNSSG